MAVLSLLLVFSHDYFHTTLISCSLRSTPEYGQESDSAYRSYRYDYSFFDYNFVQVFYVIVDFPGNYLQNLLRISGHNFAYRDTVTRTCMIMR